MKSDDDKVVGIKTRKPLSDGEKSPSRARGLRPATRGTRQGNGVGQGDGYGGPAKGASIHLPLPSPVAKLIPGQPPEKIARTKAKAIDQERDSEEMLTIILEMARDEQERTEWGLTAAKAALDRLQGLPVARSIVDSRKTVINQQVPADPVEAMELYQQMINAR